MQRDRPDVIEILENEKAWYLDQIKRINIAIDALSGSGNAVNKGKSATRSVAWSKEIDLLFEHDVELSFDDIRNRLAEKGIANALDEKCKSIINSTLSRKVGNTLKKTEEGKYRKKIESAPVVPGAPKSGGLV